PRARRTAAIGGGWHRGRVGDRRRRRHRWPGRRRPPGRLARLRHDPHEAGDGLMPEQTSAIRVRFTDAPDAMAAIVRAVADAGGSLRTLATPRVTDGVAEAELEVSGMGE